MKRFKKFIVTALAVSLGCCFFLGVGAVPAYAETPTTEESTGMGENTAETPSKFDGNETIDEAPETGLSPDLGAKDEPSHDDNENATLDDLKQLIEGYFQSKKDEDGKVNLGAILADAKTWTITAVSFIFSTFGGAIVASVLNRINGKKSILTQAQIEAVSKEAANRAVEKVVGKSIDVDISAEVSKSVKESLYALVSGFSELSATVKNVEALTANVAKAQSKSKLLTAEEKQTLTDGANKALTHADKVKGAAKIEVSAQETPTAAEEPLAAEKAETAERNLYYINFGGGDS